MGKKGSSINKKGSIATASSYFASKTLREESSGKKQKSVSAKSMLKVDHIKNLAIWAGGEASIPSLGAFFGHRLAATAEALDVLPDPSVFSCQRCESILQPGYNCTVRIEKNKAKVGTSKHHMKDLCPPKAKPVSTSDPIKLTTQKASKPEVATESKDNIIKMDIIALPETANDDPMVHSPKTPMTTPGTTLLDSKRRKRTRPGGKRAVESGSGSATPDAENATGASSKRKRKSWTSLKEIAERDEQENRRNFTNLAIPLSNCGL